MKRHALPLNALRAFEATARLGKMSQAADELCVTHSAISRQIRGLESQLGIQLLTGPRNQQMLTEKASQLLPRLTLAFDILEEAVTSCIEAESQALNVSCPGTLSMRWLIPRLYDFRDQYPDTEIRLSAGDGQIDLRHDNIDVAIRIHHQFDESLNVTPLFADFAGPVLSPALLPPEDGLSLETLLSLPRLHTSTRMSAWNDWLSSRGRKVENTGQIFEHFYFMLEAATSGLGVAIAPQILVKDDLASGRLIAPFGFEPNGLHYAALTLPTPPKAVYQFISWLAQASRVEAG
ncbi:Glycine cleavage system transcriptional activator [Vibrio aerogenes CECT 7868]|uniref:Glycine cleavage system transcriptional activator n=1 Tax=Vibrio aerogenes CECT 7868 TaxID=1216006 RepID=A0A1M6A135_9VIBR|nr:LysR substrate-binding domain-containing protein [Vibrio aerogenes]SHI30175.1 Glycine cleavage system transcriptional activator [Vibrio aerogenes CECT 7868]